MDIKTKKQMYSLLRTGQLGNTIPLYSSVELWQASADYSKYSSWGVRCEIPGDKRMRLNVPREEVVRYTQTSFRDGTIFNISPMIDMWAIFKGEIMEWSYPPFGLCIYVNFQGSMPWREALRDYGRHYYGLQAKLLLEIYMDPSSYEDIRSLLEKYPYHVIEFSVCDRSVGIIPGRNTVIWEVRKY